MARLFLIWLHIGQLVLLPIITLAHVLRSRSIPLPEDSAVWWLVLLSIVCGFFTSLTYAFKIGFFDARAFAPKLFVERGPTRQFLMMVLVPLVWLSSAAVTGPEQYDEAAIESGVLVLAGHHLVLSLLLLGTVVRDLLVSPFEGAAGAVLAWRVLVSGLLACSVGFTLWGLWEKEGRSALMLLALSLVMELLGSVPFYRANVKTIFEDE
ncbi:MAG: hypothetical protein JNM69_28580 [Archangium sp.]|nr:hypothetical protein [Archangium sp.]